MTATGVLCMLIGILISSIGGYLKDKSSDYWARGRRLVNLGGVVFIIGSVSATAGVLVWLWRVMP